MTIRVGVFLGLGALLLVALAAPESGEVVFDRESLYHHILVQDADNVRTLYFRRGGTRYSESVLDLVEPLKLHMEYSRLMFSCLAFVERPRSILIIGLGGGTLPRVLHHYLPDAEIDCVELDPMVVEVAKKHFRFKESKAVRVYTLDGRRHTRSLGKGKKRYDIVMLDAYRGGYIPFHMTTKEFMLQCRKILSDRGVLVSNLQPLFEDYDYCRRTIASVFPEQYAFRGIGNAIVVSPIRKLGLTKDGLLERARAVQDSLKLNFDFVEVINSLEARPGYKTEGKILTDDYAPVNILRGRPRE